MGESDTSKVKTLCPSCSQKLAVPANASGRRVKCPACSSSFTIPHKKEATQGPEEHLALQREAEQTCPNCGKSLSPEAVICISCGTDTRTGLPIRPASSGGSHSSGSKQRRRIGRPFYVGCLCSSVGAIVGGAIWVAVCYYSGYEIRLVALLVGGLAGLGMYVGYGNVNRMSGIVAAATAILGILISKSIVYELMGDVSRYSSWERWGISTSSSLLDFLPLSLAALLAYKVGIHGTDALDDD